MRGLLRVIPSAGCKRPQRLVILRQAPVASFIADLLGGDPRVVETFDSILHDGEAAPCIVYCDRGAREKELPVNTWANMLWLQALVRKQGFAGTSKDNPDHITGPCIILSGDGVFMHHVAGSAIEPLRLVAN